MQRFSVLKSRYFQRLYLTFLAFFLVVGTCIILFVNTTLDTSIKERELSNMKEKLSLLEPLATQIFASTDYSDAEIIFSNTYKFTKIRFTLLVPRGEIIADSHSLPDTTVNGWILPEVTQATEHGWGVTERVVDIFAEKALIVALAVRHQDTVTGVIRAELPLSTIKNLSLEVQETVIWIAFISALLAFCFGFFITRSYAEPISQMADVCQALQAGDYSRKVTMIPQDEIGQLANTLNNLSENILEKISSLSLERAQLKSMLACMQEGIISVSDTKTILFCNLAAYNHLSCNPEDDLRGKDITHIPSLSTLAAIYERVIGEKHFKIKEFTQKSQDGEDKHLKVYATFYQSQIDEPLKDSASQSGVMIVINNHTEIKKLQQMRRDFFAHVSHELKTPLTSIQGYIDTLLDGAAEDSPAIRQRFLHKIHSNTQRLRSLVMDLLALSRIDSKTHTLNLRPLQWLPVVQKVIEERENESHKRRIHIHIEKKHSHELVIADHESMFTILDNLLSNAIRYSPENSSIIISFQKIKGYIEIHVQDNGVGIAARHLPHIFDRFYRVDKARSRKEGGTGLGLSIVHLLAKKLGGHVRAISKHHHGSTFIVTLPRAF
ncbi:MAG: ATP-binding protein [Proteobacteria bacterium]|nr:ATP-binding protein [Pseudomonadota bacterium]